jgi:hypothetical protein
MKDCLIYVPLILAVLWALVSIGDHLDQISVAKQPGPRSQFSRPEKAQEIFEYIGE